MSSIKVYKYDKNGYFSGIEKCHESPLEPGSYIFPTDSSPISPDFESDTISKWNGVFWENVPDYRGQTWYDSITGAPIAIIDIGAPPGNLTPILPEKFTIATLRANKSREIAQIAEQEILATGHNDVNMQNMLLLSLMSGNTNGHSEFKDMMAKVTSIRDKNAKLQAIIQTSDKPNEVVW